MFEQFVLVLARGRYQLLKTRVCYTGASTGPPTKFEP